MCMNKLQSGIKIALLMLVLLSLGPVLNAQNLQISGGNNFSVSLCSNGDVYVWGKNSAGQLGRDPATGIKYGVASSSTPLQIQTPSGINIAKVDAGSGATGIAMGCNGAVYTWGE